MTSDALTWLLDFGNPAVQYRTRTELLNQEDDSAGVIWARQMRSCCRAARVQNFLKGGSSTAMSALVSCLHGQTT